MTYVAENIKSINTWLPFRVGAKADRIRAMHSWEGIGDRLRAVAFAEIQARDGFYWGIEQFPNANPELLEYWQNFAEMEALHAQLLLSRAQELEVNLSERLVSDSLMRMFVRSSDVDIFLYQMCTAEERGMEIGFSMLASMEAFDPISAKIFRKIAEDEIEHVTMARKFLANLDCNKLQERAIQLSRSP